MCSIGEEFESTMMYEYNQTDLVPLYLNLFSLEFDVDAFLLVDRWDEVGAGEYFRG